MKASVLTAPRTSEIQEVPVPETGPNDVLIRVKACGVCRSELEKWQGKREGLQYPIIMGHEPAGVIEELGSHVDTFQVGQAVAVFPGSNGLFTEYRNGGFAEYLAVPQENVVTFPQEAESHKMLGEPIACLVSAVDRTNIHLADRVAIVGCGFMGLAVLQFVLQRGPKEIVTIDVRQEALEDALRLGADRAIMPEQLGPGDKAVKWEEISLGFDVVFEVSGTQQGLTLAGELVKAHGTLSIVGFHVGGLRHVDLGLWNIKGLNVINAHERRREYFIRCMQAGIDLVAKGNIDMDSLVTHKYPLEHVDQAYSDLERKAPGHIKGVILL
jgi:2-desacetyl-2-hydroxyethyl bacteriochlorophyllide A dehydrogenase